ncbi:EF-hand domain-containing protein [Sphingomonas sp.]|uniref:EF-hand domain-containing protein n=1 Tax=Sphingomonas sp. TaxID=28214 RepID=UPI0028AA917F|nr:EF-hand domain-containing protein [Sphingomonas sp.]
MRGLLVAGLMLAVSGVAQAQDAPRPRGLFVSPMGEPFRGTADGKAPQDAWFDGADADHDGALTLDEFREDAMRWFKVLDRKGDGEIDPADIEHYETVLAPEARGGGFETGGPTMGDNGEVKAADIGSTRVLSGLARFNYLGSPEPVTAADSSLNGGVSAIEFMSAAKRRFDLLDANHDGKLTKAELPELRTGAFKRGGRGGRGGGGGEGGGRRGGGGHRGGYMGGSMGGSMGG